MWKYGITNVKFNRQHTHLIRMVRIKMVPRNVRQLHHGLPTHYTHATWSSRRLKSLASRLFTQEFVQANTKGISNRWPLWGESTGDQYIHLTKGQWYGRHFHMMTSSWNYCYACLCDSSSLTMAAERLPNSANWDWFPRGQVWILWR